MSTACSKPSKEVNVEQKRKYRQNNQKEQNLMVVLGKKSLEYLIIQQEITKRGEKTLKGFK